MAPQPPAARNDCVAGSYLKGQLFGALAGDIAWTAKDMHCEGMRRPKDAGARLRFSGTFAASGDAAVKRQIAIILALPSLREAAAGKEQATRVTIIEENEGRFFSTRDSDLCWTDVHEHAPIEENAARRGRRFRLRGLLYCLAPVAELHGNGSVTLGELQFSGEVDWSGGSK